MTNPLTMFHEKGLKGQAVSMTRVIAALFAATYCYVLVRNSANAHLIGWPFCVLGVVTLLAVPLQALFVYLQVWFTSSPGQKLLHELLAKVAPALAPNTTATTATTATSTTTTASIDPSDHGAAP